MKLKDRIQFGLDENRILILGCQLLIGFQFRGAFEPGFDRLPRPTQLLQLGGLGMFTIAFALLVAPSAYHRIADHGLDSEHFDRLITRLTWPSLLPLVLGICTQFFFAGQKVLGTSAGLALTVFVGLWSLALLYGLELVVRRRRNPGAHRMEENAPHTETKDKLRHVLTEARLVIPGVQALIGFQFALILMDSFDTLPQSSKYLHLVSLTLIGLTLAILLTPAAYHRVVERGEDTEHMHQVASRLVLVGTFPLAVALALDFYVVSEKVLHHPRAAALAAVGVFVLLGSLWFLYPLLARARRG